MSEISKYRHLIEPYCKYGNGSPAPCVDLGSGGDPVVSWAWQVELPPDQYLHYNAGNKPRGPIQLFGDAFRKFVESSSLWAVVSSHLMEDKPQSEWPLIMRTWMEPLMPGGHLIILVPEFNLWKAALDRGQPPNCSHSPPEPSLGDMSKCAKSVGLEVVSERLTNLFPDDYSIIGIFRKANL